MKRQRSIAGTPFRTGFESWSVLVDLVVRSLESSRNIAAGSVAAELGGMEGIGSAMAISHLAASRIVLVAEPLWVEFDVVTGEDAFDVDEDLSIIPGAATAAADWRLYLPSIGSMDEALAAAAESRSHVTVDAAPEPAVSSPALGLDADALRRQEGAQ